MLIREMLKEDLDQVVRIEKNITSQPWTNEDFVSAMNKASNIYLVAEEEFQIFGYVGMWGIADEGQIYNVAVDQRYRKRGIGYAMMFHLLQRGRDMGLKKFFLEVRKSNHSAIHLYKRLGFRAEGTRRNFYSFPTEDAVVMGLQG